MFESLDKKFDVEHESPLEPVVESPSTELEVYVGGEKPALENDMDVARRTIHDLLAKGTAAVEQALRIAESSEHPRAYEVAGGLIKSVSETARDLMEINKAKKVIDKPDAGTKQTIKNQNVFVGTTKELFKAIRQHEAEEAMVVEAEISE
jgi:hypothetical protein